VKLEITKSPDDGPKIKWNKSKSRKKDLPVLQCRIWTTRVHRRDQPCTSGREHNMSKASSFWARRWPRTDFRSRWSFHDCKFGTRVLVTLKTKVHNLSSEPTYFTRLRTSSRNSNAVKSEMKIESSCSCKMNRTFA
jgi:hypothetical protein